MVRKSLAVTGLALLALWGAGCQGDDAVNINDDDVRNTAPVIRSLTVDKTTIPSGGIIQVVVDAVDVDKNDVITPDYKAEHGIWTRPVDTLWRAQYTHDGSAGTSDVITVTVTDLKGGKDTKSQTIVIQPKTP
jgi:hypothetical protein